MNFFYFSLTPSSYTQNGILHMLDRNRRIKHKPDRFQSCKDKFNLIVSCEERVYDQILEGLELYVMITIFQSKTYTAMLSCEFCFQKL